VSGSFRPFVFPSNAKGPYVIEEANNRKSRPEECKSMDPRPSFPDSGSLMFATLVVTLAFAAQALAASKPVVYDFQPSNQYPPTGLVSDQAGNLYGSAYSSTGVGNIYKVSPPAHEGGKWTKTTIFTFNGTNGALPQASLTADSKGNLYGATFDGGTGNCNFNIPGCGVVFELSPPLRGRTWTETVLYNFQAGKDGTHPQSPLVLDTRGNLYGSTSFGGDMSCADENGLGCGVVFELSPATTPGSPWNEKVLHAFHGGPDGAVPGGPLFLKEGVLFGTTSQGGVGRNCRADCGIAFSVNRSGQEKVIHRFTGKDGSGPFGLTGDSAGNLFGITGLGGEFQWGVIFELIPSSGGNWTETVLYSFTGGTDGGNPTAVIPDNSGNLYGTTYTGGDANDCGWEPPYMGCGVAFKLAPPNGSGTWTESVLHTFTGSTAPQDPDGGIPWGVIFGKTGLLYGATMIGGTGDCYTSMGINSGCGTVFELTPVADVNHDGLPDIVLAYVADSLNQSSRGMVGVLINAGK
jgi:hypothetical protein